MFISKTEKTGLQEISLNNIYDKLLANHKKNVLFVGRNSCVFCSVYSEELDEWAKKHNYPVYNYDAENDYNENQSKLKNAINYLNIKSIPAIVLIESNGTFTTYPIENIYEIEKMIKEFL